MYLRLRTACVTIGASLLLAQAALATASRDATIDFGPAATSSLQKDYGAKEADVLRSAILTALAKQESHASVPDGLTLKVTVRKVAPSHPTMEQQLHDPSLSPARTRYLGGADLVGEVRDSRQQVLATVNYSDFVGQLAAASPSLDPWADARQVIDTFAAKLAATWDKLPRS